MGYNPKNFVYVIQVTDYTEDEEENYLLPESFMSRAEARKRLAAEARSQLSIDKGLMLEDVELDGLDDEDEVILAEKYEPNYFMRIEVLELELYDTFKESQNEP